MELLSHQTVTHSLTRSLGAVWCLSTHRSSGFFTVGSWRQIVVVNCRQFQFDHHHSRQIFHSRDRCPTPKPAAAVSPSDRGRLVPLGPSPSELVRLLWSISLSVFRVTKIDIPTDSVDSLTKRHKKFKKYHWSCRFCSRDVSLTQLGLILCACERMESFVESSRG